MHDDLIQILALYEADEVLYKGELALDAARALVSDAEQALTDAIAARDAARKAAAAGTSEANRLKREVASYEQRRSGAVRALEMGSGDPDAAERQIVQCTKILDDLETQQLENMEAQEDLDDAVRAAESGVADAEDTLAEARKVAPPEIERLIGEVAAAKTALEAVEAKSRRDLRKQYRVVRERKRRVVTELDSSNACVVCHQIPPMGQLSDAKRGAQLLVCRGCKRWIVV